MMNTLIVILSALLSAIFLLASSIKLTGWQKKVFEIQLDFFHKYGLNRKHMFGVGAIEFYGAVTLWLPGLIGLSGSLAIFFTSIGAIFCHLKYDTWKAGVPAMFTFVFSGALSILKITLLN